MTEDLEILRQVWLELDKIFGKKTPTGQTKIQKDINPNELVCSDKNCRKPIPQVVADYSKRFYGNYLCRDCQLKYKKLSEKNDDGGDEES